MALGGGLLTGRFKSSVVPLGFQQLVWPQHCKKREVWEREREGIERGWEESKRGGEEEIGSVNEMGQWPWKGISVAIGLIFEFLLEQLDHLLWPHWTRKVCDVFWWAVGVYFVFKEGSHWLWSILKKHPISGSFFFLYSFHPLVKEKSILCHEATDTINPKEMMKLPLTNLLTYY